MGEMLDPILGLVHSIPRDVRRVSESWDCCASGDY